MSAPATVRKLTVVQYLSDPELEKLELVDGVAVETGVGNKNHGAIQLPCGYLIKAFLRTRSSFYAATELCCRSRSMARPVSDCRIFAWWRAADETAT